MQEAINEITPHKLSKLEDMIDFKKNSGTRADDTEDLVGELKVFNDKKHGQNEFGRKVKKKKRCMKRLPILIYEEMKLQGTVNQYG